jgi:hypothetical protein
MTRNHKAIISKSGESIEFYVDGKSWRAAPDGEWLVVGPDGLSGKGISLWDAVGDARRSRDGFIETGA